MAWPGSKAARERARLWLLQSPLCALGRLVLVSYDGFLVLRVRMKCRVCGLSSGKVVDDVWRICFLVMLTINCDDCLFGKGPVEPRVGPRLTIALDRASLANKESSPAQIRDR